MVIPYSKKLWQQKVWQIGRLGRENIGRLCIYTEGNEGKTERLADNTLLY